MTAASFSFALNPQWHVAYVQSEQDVSLALTLSTAALSGAEEALFQAYMIEAKQLLPEPLVIKEVQQELDRYTLHLGADSVAQMYTYFQQFWSALIALNFPEVPVTYPAPPLRALELSFLSGILAHTAYAERIDDLASRGLADLSFEALLSRMPLRLFLQSPEPPSQCLSWLQNLCDVPWIYREASMSPLMPYTEPLIIDYDLPLPGVWFDIGFRVPGHQQVKPVYLELWVRLFEQLYLEYTEQPGLLLLDAGFHQWEQLGYVRFRFQGEDPRQLKAYQAEIMDALIALRHHALTEYNFKQMCEKGISEPVLFRQWYAVTHHYLGVNYLCWHQSLRLSLFEANADLLYEKYPLLGYVDPAEAAQAIGVYKQNPETFEQPGRTVVFQPDTTPGLAVELLFHSGTLLENHGGTLRLLGHLLAAELSQRLSLDWQVQWDHQFLSLEGRLPWKRMTRWLEILGELGQQTLADFVKHVDLPQIKKQQGLAVLTEGLEPYAQAYEVFLKTAFPNHPYGRPISGSYQSISLVQSHHLEALWRRIKTEALTLTFRGQIPVFLNFSHVDSALKLWPEAQLKPLNTPHFQGRRGTIYAELPPQFSLIGRAFSPPSAEVQLVLFQLEQRLQHLFQSTPVHHELKVFEQAWCLLFWGHETNAALQRILEPFGQQLAAESAKVFEAYYLTGADWIQVCAAPQRF